MKISVENRSALLRSSAALGVVALMLVLPAVASAQAAPSSDEKPGNGGQQAVGGLPNDTPEASTAEDIVVTGTILRGAAPVGSNLISVGQQQMQAQGATTANELLATIPQVSNLFNNVPNSRLAVAANQIQVVRPNLRNLSGETSSSASTLVLVDGHRIAPVGVTQNAVDPDLIPGIAIERVEVVTDGGSATYGSDAVGGVVNFITRKRFNGVKVQGSYGIADSYHQVEGSAIVGKDWGSGSLFAAYTYQHNDAIYGRDRSWIRDVDWLSTSLTPRGRSCTPGNVQIGATLFALPGLAAGANSCDPTDNGTVIPTSTRHGALAGLHQDLATWLSVDLRAFYGERKATTTSEASGSVNLAGVSSPGFPQFGIPPSARSFYYTPVPGQSPTATETVFFNLSPLLGTDALHASSAFQEWGANAEFKADITHNWQLRTLFNYSSSASQYHIQGFNGTLLNAYASGSTAATAINFYNPGAGANDLPLIQQLVNSEIAGEGREQLFNTHAIIDGTLFTLPGGGVKLAAGYEYTNDAFQQRIAPANQPIGAMSSVAFTPYGRHIHSFFGELQVPIVGADNRMGFIYSLTLDGSVRYDHFSDFGGTTNPKIGVNFKPVSWLGFRGNYGTSFNAPSPVDELGALRNTASFFPFNAFVRPGDTPTATGTVAIQGSNPGLTPQTAKTWSAGIEIDPPFLAGLHASASYYNVKFKNLIGTPSSNNTIFANFPNLVTSNQTGLTLTQIQNFLNTSGAPGAAATLASVAGRCNGATGICNVYELVDFRQGNYGTLNVEGLDLSANYRTKTTFGGIDAGVAANYTLSRKTQTGAGAPVIDQLVATNMVLPNGQRLVNNASSRLQLQATIGADIGHFRAQATLNHTSGFAVVRCDPTTTPACTPSATGVPTANGLPQDRVSAFNTVNLFFKYDVPSASPLFKDLSFTLNVNNVLDQDPPIFRQIGASTAGYSNGFTLGRLIQFGVSKKF